MTSRNVGSPLQCYVIQSTSSETYCLRNDEIKAFC